MAVTNSLAPKKKEEQKMTYQVNGAEVTLSPSIVRNYLTNGNGNVTDQEVVYFLNLCKYQKLNPLVKECYLIKYGSQPATMVTSKDALLKRAMRNPKYKGHEAGVIVRVIETGELEYRKGSFIIEGEEELIGGWAKTYVDGYAVPIEAAVSFKEFAGYTKDGNLNSMWAGKPGSMIRKTALVTSLREAFPDDLSGMYASEEVGVDFDDTTGTAPVEIPQQEDHQDSKPNMLQGADVWQGTGQVPEQQTTMEELQGF